MKQGVGVGRVPTLIFSRYRPHSLTNNSHFCCHFMFLKKSGTFKNRGPIGGLMIFFDINTSISAIFKLFKSMVAAKSRVRGGCQDCPKMSISYSPRLRNREGFFLRGMLSFRITKSWDNSEIIEKLFQKR